MENKNKWAKCRRWGSVITSLFLVVAVMSIFSAGLALGREGAVVELLLAISYGYIIYGFSKHYKAPMAFWLAWYPVLIYPPALVYITSVAELPLGSVTWLLAMTLPGLVYLVCWKWGADAPSVRIGMKDLGWAVVLIVVPTFLLANSFIDLTKDRENWIPYPDTPQSAYYEFQETVTGSLFGLEFLRESYRCDEKSEQYQEVAEVGGYCLRETHNPALNADMVSYRLTAPREGLQGHLIALRTEIFFQDCAQYDQSEQVVCEAEQAPYRNPLVVETLKAWFEKYADQAVASFNKGGF